MALNMAGDPPGWWHQGQGLLTPDFLQGMGTLLPATRSCNCVGGPNCCIKVAERDRETAIRREERHRLDKERAVAEERRAHLADREERQGRTPHRCPVCAGRGSMPIGFYGPRHAATGGNDERCRTCSGSGLVWSESATGRDPGER